MARGSASVTAWRRAKRAGDLDRYAGDALAIFAAIKRAVPFDAERYHKILRRHPRDGRGMFSKNLLIRIYRHLCAAGRMVPDPELLARLRMKPIRTLSGVATVTVLTEPHPCPGRCIFCPTDVKMPKSYLADEPGAQRAEQNAFDPYRQVAARLEALETNGHPTDKVELLILGGTWSSYAAEYQEWFVQRALDAIHGRPSTSLAAAQNIAAHAARRNVGLVIETRPDWVSPQEVLHLRSLGVTKVQLGAQSLNDQILAQNRRGHTVDDTRRAVGLLRRAGFKIVLHWMPNLLGATPGSDRQDFQRLFDDPALKPDELKIYPCALVREAELYEDWQRGAYRPYSEETLVALVAQCKTLVPPYCRINRIHRDIPSTYVVCGTKASNLRQLAQAHLARTGRRCACIRCQEVRRRPGSGDWQIEATPYPTAFAQEVFLAARDQAASLLGFARLSLPAGWPDPALAAQLPELAEAALIRELHVYGQALGIGRPAGSSAQHRGVGSALLARAEAAAAQAGYARMAVIAAVGTRAYYAARGYVESGTYMTKTLTASGRASARCSPRGR